MEMIVIMRGDKREKKIVYLMHRATPKRSFICGTYSNLFLACVLFDFLPKSTDDAMRSYLNMWSVGATGTL